VNKLLNCDIAYTILFLKNLKNNYEEIFIKLFKLYSECDYCKLKKYLEKIKNDCRFTYCPEKNVIKYTFDAFFVKSMNSLNNFLSIGKYYNIDNVVFPIPNYVDNFYKLLLMIKYISQSNIKSKNNEYNDFDIKKIRRPIYELDGKLYLSYYEFLKDDFNNYLKLNNLSGKFTINLQNQISKF